MVQGSREAEVTTRYISRITVRGTSLRLKDRQGHTSSAKCPERTGVKKETPGAWRVSNRARLVWTGVEGRGLEQSLGMTRKHQASLCGGDMTQGSQGGLKAPDEMGEGRVCAHTCLLLLLKNFSISFHHSVPFHSIIPFYHSIQFYVIPFHSFLLQLLNDDSIKYLVKHPIPQAKISRK